MGEKKSGKHNKRPRLGQLTKGFDVDARDSYAASRLLALIGAFEMDFFMNEETGVFYANEKEEKEIY